MLVPVARLVGPHGWAVGVDLAPAMVRLTAADLADLPGVEVRIDDAQAPDFPPRSFDLVGSSLVLFFHADRGPALRRWTTSLVPGGRLGVTTLGEQDRLRREVDAVFLPDVPAALKDARTSGTTGPFGSDAGMEVLLADAGWSTSAPACDRDAVRAARSSSACPGSGSARRSSRSPRTYATRWVASRSWAAG